MIKLTAVVSSLALCFSFNLLAATPAELAWRNAVSPPPPGWQGPVFQLSHNYPTEMPPPCDKSVCKWLDGPANLFKTDFSEQGVPEWDQQWQDYIMHILNYVREQQDPYLRNEQGWKVQVNGSTRWFHVPWMAYDPTTGREFIHGFTNERTAVLSDFFGKRGLHGLAAAGKDAAEPRFETWAFGVYNPHGAYVLGQAWGKDGKPVLTSYAGNLTQAGLPFPEGTVVAKLLFSTVTPEQVAYLAGSPAWMANRHIEQNNQFFCQRKPQPVHLVQLDVAVVDSRSPTNWVYGTFAYNAGMKGETPWDNLSPVGLQWGMDPWTFPAVPKAESIPARQSVLNQSDINVQAEHFGCHQRLAGPVDNKLSSCLSCHGNAFASPDGRQLEPFSPNIFGFEGQCEQYSAENVAYFQNLKYPMGPVSGSFPNTISFDTSLQMWVAFGQYWQYARDGAPQPCQGGH
ncbi:hypothetical protein [Alkalimonas amylolytica]|uniref:Cytochrome c domain-containing protein n=1 Tax=Alkalimonas amylolytica TaxID=152573 RepID=A0A1H3ZIF8_ALKAM|nr:hypothetical protein [Alkalimonas amylolytica]SEA23556.1 hypothetical protein SAMN04488051_102206 [Alkalimonas amylolytica]